MYSVSGKWGVKVLVLVIMMVYLLSSYYTTFLIL